MYILYGDGSCLGNPGPGGAAWRLMKSDETVIEEGAESCAQQTTNNRMELRAAIRGIAALSKSGATPGTVEMRLDSTYVLDGIFQYLPGWTARGFAKVKNPDLWGELVDTIEEAKTLGFTFTRNWVKGHATDAHNNAVDKMANDAAGRAKAMMETGKTETFISPVVAAAPVAEAQAPAPQAAPDGRALSAARMLLLLARDEATTPAEFLAEIHGMKDRLGL